MFEQKFVKRKQIIGRNHLDISRSRGVELSANLSKAAAAERSALVSWLNLKALDTERVY